MNIIKVDKKVAGKLFRQAKLRILKDAKDSKDKYGRPSPEDMNLPMTE